MHHICVYGPLPRQRRAIALGLPAGIKLRFFKTVPSKGRRGSRGVAWVRFQSHSEELSLRKSRCDLTIVRGGLGELIDAIRKCASPE